MKILAAAVTALAEQTKPSDRDCCVFARSVLRHAYGAEVVDQVEVARWHLVVPPSGPWEPVLAARDAGLTLEVTGGDRTPTTREGHWVLCQGWRGVPLAAGVTGHTWLALDLGGGWCEVLDSARQRGPRLVGLQRWTEVLSPFHGGVVAGVLRRPGGLAAG